ncbi:formate dehydrogenase subunit delta [Rhodobium orientis]|uniref:Formate dehydrogenase n=1 Tax=Rhodobium orientis TaxID=34017 RepID=A0A327JNE7_9HYPH|nr:formate dehydrogenase subunit delta [Rhodobium orientis]MBB4301341.1 formate dehydrogenase subunit delta [Rhodobium orientis]MBK5951071.1 formate dehydrogenase [Rhodobium orientis]RAI26864.1 formate dehydrogenase [Rhodobium orientis]
MSPEKMVHMANQIAGFFKSQPSADRAEKVAAHINDFWEPRMRSQLADYVASGGKGLDPLVLQAMEQVRVPVD